MPQKNIAQLYTMLGIKLDTEHYARHGMAFLRTLMANEAGSVVKANPPASNINTNNYKGLLS